LIERCRRHPLTRALRIDKLTLAGLEATLKLYLDPELALRSIPTLRMLTLGLDQLRAAANELATLLRNALPGSSVHVLDGHSQAGGGALPGSDIPTALVAVSPCRPVHEVEAELRHQEPPVMVRVQRGQILLDPRTLWPEELAIVAAALAAATAEPRHSTGSEREQPGGTEVNA
jgi:L-seryl-tRNA(Ser) seleniumtransferase